jgi:fructose-bisphosphate aldolase, class II
MTLATLTDVLMPALRGGYAVAGLVVLGWEDAVAFVAAAEAEGAPVILQAGPGARAYTPLPVLAAMFRTLGERASVPVVAHLDHGRDLSECRQAIDCGFTSVMFDGSALPLDQNIAATDAIVTLAHKAGIPVEAELGVVGYTGAAASQGTDPDMVARFIRETRIDALAVSVGNIHLMQNGAAAIDLPRLRAIEAAAPSVPLVIHGGSGVPPDQRSRLARTTSICKFNIGTDLRRAFGASLHRSLASDPDRFDRIAILSATIPDLTDAARAAIRSCSGP